MANLILVWLGVLTYVVYLGHVQQAHLRESVQSVTEELECIRDVLAYP